MAFVRLAAGTTACEEDLFAYCKRGIAGYKVPRKICLLDEFPVVTGPNGVKIQRHRLREMAEALLTGG